MLKNKLRLQVYCSEIIYKPGETNAADYLSRHPESKNFDNKVVKMEIFVDNVIVNALPDVVTTADIQYKNKHDQATQMLKNTISKEYIQ